MVSDRRVLGFHHIKRGASDSLRRGQPVAKGAKTVEYRPPNPKEGMDDPTMPILFGVLFVASIVGLILVTATPSRGRGVYSRSFGDRMADFLSF